KALAEIKSSLDKVLEQYAGSEPQPPVTEPLAELVVPVADVQPPVLVETPAPVTEEVQTAPQAVAGELPAEAETEEEPGTEEPEAEETEEEEERSPQQIFLDAMGQTTEAPKGPVKKKDKDKDKGKKGGRDRVLVFDEELGRTVVQRSRKPGRAGEFLDDLDEE
ncbi:MAG TPA: hypothetical protein VGK81_07530, partial [Anaerolineae bacterium]